MSNFSPDSYLSHTTDVNRGCVDVIAEGTVENQIYIAGPSPEDITFTARAIGCLDFTEIPDTKTSTIESMLDTITNWEIF